MIESGLIWQWSLLIVFGLIFFLLAPYSKTANQFFSAQSKKGKRPGFFLLTGSLVISWIFAKSITNAANLGLEFGWVGGLAYSVYYLSFLTAGLVIYQIRTKGKFNSIHEFLSSKFGRSALIIFSILIAFRLFNEVWSNTMVIGSYFGAIGSDSYYYAILVFTVLTLAYTLKGGLRSSLLTDAIQLILFAVLLSILLGMILPDPTFNLDAVIDSGSWSWGGGLNLMLVAFIQIFSYPFHDPVLTDRGFISSPNITLKSFFWAALIGFICILVFSLVGVYAKILGFEGQAAVEVGKLLGVVAMLVMNFIMVTSAASTLDSTFSSFSKLVINDLGLFQKAPVKSGRIVMIAVTLAGTLPVFANPEILSATTISGTMVIGLAPIFLLWNYNVPKISFYLAIGGGVLIGVILAIGYWPTSFNFTHGRYASLLSANTFGSILVFLLFLLPVGYNHVFKKN